MLRRLYAEKKGKKNKQLSTTGAGFGGWLGILL